MKESLETECDLDVYSLKPATRHRRAVGCPEKGFCGANAQGILRMKPNNRSAPRPLAAVHDDNDSPYI